MASRIREMMEAMPGAFLPEKAGNSRALIQLVLTGDDGGNWVIDVADGQCQVREELAARSDVTVTMNGDDFVALYKDQMNPVSAFMSGKIKVSGNVGMVMQLLNWFQR
ncbi:MAG: SCP2 sterol-binding domain-containing protein [Anaerolineae bacterium]|nr:SCP2 sterol-binding domain-containing protein [Anaerolineae bacterium]